MSDTIKATIKTNKGNIEINLFSSEAPLTVANFINLAKRGFYRDIGFHRVIDNFMIQAGCPRGDGTGGPGYRFQDEFNPNLRHSKAGILSMANAGPGTNGSQFFITHGPTPHLDDMHTVFGETVNEDSLAVVNAIGQGDIIDDITISGDTDALVAQHSAQLSEWNNTLDKNFSHLDAQQ